MEGTTTPVTFVTEVLFPFARARLATFRDREGVSPDIRAALDLVRNEQAAETASGQAVPADLTAYLEWLMDRDRKSPGLKALQGLIWRDGYRTGELRGDVYPDVPPALRRWKEEGRRVFIYSSGSVLAQKLLFASTPVGDLTRYLVGHFDTAVGPKTAPDSYATIARQIGTAPSEALFVSDVEKELDAARLAGWETVLCVREPVAPPSEPGHPVVRSFHEIA